MWKDLKVKTIQEIINKLKVYTPQLNKEAQTIQAMEECGELIQAIAKELNDKPRDNENVKEEIADVLIMVIQMMFYFSTEKETIKYINKKITKIQNYLEMNKNE